MKASLFLCLFLFLATSESTSSPTSFPTTFEPSNKPTDSPTSFPTTFQPTDKLSDKPTNIPTSFPTTSEPTDSPTYNPSDNPTNDPSDSPTSFPTTSEPTDSPTYNSSDNPTNGPSDSPTSTPTTSDPTPSPSSPPSTIPTSSPSNSPSVSITPSDSPTITCVNGDSYKIDNDPIKTCKWVRNKEYRRIPYCQREDVHINCPLSCGVCCRDDPTYTFITAYKQIKDCAWIAKNPWRPLSYCDAYSSGRMVRNACPATCNLCKSYIFLAPSTSPSLTPFPTPSSEPSDSPTIACVNDDSYKIDNDPIKTCKWVRNKEFRRTRHCRREDVHINCPLSCGVCCRDDPTYTFITAYKQTKDCAWIAKNPWRANSYCDAYSNGRMVRNACPLTCNLCKSYIFLAPSTSPSSVPSDSPTITPSTVPSMKPSTSNNPSTTPTSVQSYNPTFTCINEESYKFDDDPIKTCKWVRNKELRRISYCQREDVNINCPVSCGVCCRDDPTYTLVTDLGITQDCAWIAKHPNPRANKYCNTYNSGQMVRDACPSACDFCRSYISVVPSSSVPSDSPTITPSIVPSMKPSILPSNGPSIMPSSVPSGNPTFTCVNDDKYKIDNDPIKTCKWVRNKEFRRISYCQREDVNINCPVSCGVCCRDDPTYTLVIDLGKTQDCAWIAKHPNPRANKYCDTYNSGQMVRDACPSVCDFCKSYISVAPNITL